MFDRFICDFVYRQDHRIEMTEVISADESETYAWLEDTFMELHMEVSCTPDLLRLRRDDEILTIWETHFDVVR